ncbi:MAG: 1-aminocyclopropane-1-carboxylate deaminase/D-cysteine desulfhydrase [Promethearchaeota archaeon]
MISNPLNIPEINRPLFAKYPQLTKIPWMPLMDGVPTPVQQMTGILETSNKHEIWIKRDDLTSSIYGGNKPRKFEFLFADAMAKKKKVIVTAGGIGTNHGIATALFCDKLGLKSKIFMFEQPLTWSVQRKLLIYTSLNSELKFTKSYLSLVFYALQELMFHPDHYIMLPGGSPLLGIGSPRGSLGFVNAAFELKEQVDNGDVPEPDYLFIPAGSTGTASGLIVGCKLVGLKTKVVPVQVSESMVTNAGVIEKNSKKTLKMMRKHDKSIPNLTFKNGTDFMFIEGYLGSKYGAVTRSGLNAVDLFSQVDEKMRIHLETTYTGKTAAAMLDFIDGIQDDEKKVILFWNTYNSRELKPIVEKSGLDHSKLPCEFQQYFDLELACWIQKKCSESEKKKCVAYLKDDWRCWKIKELNGINTKNCENCEVKKAILKLHPVEDA